MSMLNPSSLAAALGGEQTGQNKVRAPGPEQDPSDRSLEITIDSKYADGFSARSFYGEDWRDAKDHVRSKLGQDRWDQRPKDDPIKRMTERASAKSLGKIVATYDYTDADGTLLYQSVRYNPKDFRQRRPDGRGGWIYKLDDKRVVYRWADLLKYPDATVFICEGEKDADRVAGLGQCATTIAGDGTWTDDCVSALAGRDLFILEDNDEPGRTRSLKAAAALSSVAKSIRIVKLPGLADKGDISDWLDGDPSLAETLIDVCMASPKWKPSKPSENADSTAPAAEKTTFAEEPRIRATPYEWKDPASISRREWLYGRLLIRKFLTGTVAPGGVGKSSLIVAETLAGVSCKPLLGVTAPKKLRVWVWNLEDPQEETERKIQAAALRFNLTADDIGDRLFVDSGRDQPLVMATSAKNGTVIARPVIENLITEAIERRIDVIVVDPFVSCHEAGENDNQAMDMIAKEWGKVADHCNCAVHLVHHTRKGEQEVTTESSRGGKALTDACRVVRTVNRMSKEEAGKAGVENHRLYFRTINDKTNLAPPADQSDWFKLESIDLGNGPLNSPGDSIGVVTTWQWPDPLAGVTGADFDKAAAAIRVGTWRDHIQSKDWVGKAVAKALGFDLDSKADKAKVAGMISVWLAAGSLSKVEGLDEKRMPKWFVEVSDQT